MDISILYIGFLKKDRRDISGFVISVGRVRGWG